MPLQQGEVVLQLWPYSPHAGPPLLEPVELLVVPLLVVPLLVVPLLELLLVHGPQTPSVLPGSMMQLEPGQQSALTVHLPQVCTHP
jgi:hypothetical protein